MTAENIIIYRLALGPDEIVEFEIDVAENPSVKKVGMESLPEWTRLDFFRCDHCNQDTILAEFCPLAVPLVRVMDRFQAIISHDTIDLEVINAERRVCRTTTAQRALSSLMGLIIATSGCSHTEFLRPMARFHLPLANETETVFRAASTYMLGQYFRHKEGKDTDLGLDGLNRMYHNLHMVNMNVVKRLRHASRTDSSVNALILLDLYTKMLPFSLAESLEEFRSLFTAYLA